MRRDLQVALGALALAALIPTAAPEYWVGIGISALLSLALAQSWSVFSALSGYISLGHVVFYGLGAYVMVVTWNQVSIPVAVIAAALAAGVFAAIIGYPVLRVRGPYFVILTFGVAELVKYIVLAVEAKLGHASRMLLGAPTLTTLYYWMLGLAIAATLLGYAVRASRLGRGLRAIRENEEAAATIGVPTTGYKLAAFVLSALIPGAAGAVMAVRTTYFEPIIAFDPMISFTMIAMTIIGGGDNLRGPIIGALFLFTLQELLWTHAPQLYMILLGILLIAFVLFLPGGLSGGLPRARRRE